MRKACVENICTISEISDKETRENNLTAIILKMIKDNNKWVKLAAYKCLGPFISSLSGMKISEKLFEAYCQMASSSVNNLSSDNNEIMSACSFYFPAVVAALGPKKWPSLSKMFHILIKKPPEVK